MSEIRNKIADLVAGVLNNTDMFLIDLKISASNHIQVFIDSDTGFSIGKSAELNRQIYGLISDSAIFPDDDFSLEVSSPGVGEPLTSLRQYKKNIGRHVRVTLKNPESSEVSGVLKEVSGEQLVIAVPAKVKGQVRMQDIEISNVYKLIVEIVF